MDHTDYHIIPPKRDVTTTDIMAPSPTCSTSTGTQEPHEHLHTESTGYISRESTGARVPSVAKSRTTNSRTIKSRTTVRRAVDPVVQCPICCEAMTSPKMLTCLHNACKKCLQSYILSELRHDIQNDTDVMTFPCPVCRQDVTPPNPDIGVEKWVDQFPTNHFLHTYGMILSVQREDVECDPCQRRGESTLATWWCRECSDYQCNVCKTVHGGFKLFKHHNVIAVQDIAKNPDIAVPKYEPCLEHKEKISNFCRDHRAPCCGSCVISRHRKCDHVVSIQEEFELLKENEGLQKMSTKLREYEEMANEMTEFRKGLTGNLEQRKHDIITEIDEIRKEFGEILDRLRDQLINELEEFHAKQLDDLTQLTMDCENLGKQITNAKKLIETVEHSGSESHVISLMESINRESYIYERELRERQSKLQHVDYIFRIDPIISNAIKGAKSLGSVSLERSQNSQTIDVVNPIHKGIVKEVRSIKVWIAGDRGHCNIVGGVFLDDDRILVADHENYKIKLFTDHGRLLSLLKLNNKPSDLTQINDRKFAVTYPSANKLQFIMLEGNTLRTDDSQCVDTNRMYTGLSCFGDCIYLLCRTGIAICDTGGKEKTFLKSREQGMPSFKAPAKIRAGPSGLLVTDQRAGRFEKDLLHVVSKDGRLLHSFASDNFQAPVGVDLNSQGDIFVCCRKSSTVHQLTPDGRRSIVVLTEKDAMEQPSLIKFQKYADKFWVTDASLPNRDHLKIFLLT